MVYTRINIASIIHDTRAAQLSAKLGQNVTSLLDSYLLEADLPETKIQELAQCLVDPKKESLLDKSKLAQFNYALEIGFLPGVTDNVATTVKKILADASSTQFNVFSSQILLVSTNLSAGDLLAAASPLYNPLIQRAIVKTQDQFLSEGMGLQAPKVELVDETQTLEVDLDLSDEALMELSNKGIKDQSGNARGPLALGLDYMKAIQAHFRSLGRKPTDIELESIAQTWSEHCKHTIFADPIDELEQGLYKGYIKAATNQVRKNKGDKDFCVSVFTDNSGAIEFDDEYLITHKVETHNSPSALDPFGGAITGIVGVNRDAIGTGMGAKPIANLYGYCFGNQPCSQSPETNFCNNLELYRDKALTQPMLSPQRIMEGVIEGVKVGGNCSGIPTVHGFSYFHPSYRAKPLVFVGTLGLMPRKVNGKDSTQKSARPGDLIVMLGGRVGLDGIHGATFSSVEMDSSSPATAVQIGDPITQKKFSDAIVKEARDRGLYSSITDNGAGGISCSVAEMARECGGCSVELDKVPLKYPGMQAWQIWISESQERMTLAVPPENWDELSRLFKSRDVEATVIGKFTDSGKCEVEFQGEKVMDLELEFLHNGLPKRQLKTRKPSKDWIELNTSSQASTKQSSLEDLLANPNYCSKEFISQQYDHEVQAVSVLKPLQGDGRVNADTAVIRPNLKSNKAAVISYGLKPEETDNDPYNMAARTIDVSIAAAVATGADPDRIAILDNFCWCSSDEPERLYQLKETARACHDYAIAFGTPFISGKDSMFNDFRGYTASGEQIKISALPTLLVSALGVIDDYSRVLSMDLKFAGDKVYLLAPSSQDQVDAGANLDLYRRFYQNIELVSSAVSLAHKPLLVALAQKAICGQLGVDLNFDAPLELKQLNGAIAVSIDPAKQSEFEAKFSEATLLGQVTDTKQIKINSHSLSLEEATRAYRKPFAKYLAEQKEEMAGVC